jgi:hypothetical protein
MEDVSLGDINVGIVIIILGCLLFIYRDTIGDLTGYFVGRGKIVDKPTPGWMLVPFALGIIVVGSVFLVRGIYKLFAA